MDTLEVKEYEGEEGFDECVECGSREVSVIMKSTIVRIALCEHCFKEFTASCNALLPEIEKQCRYCLHYIRKPGHYDYGGECKLTKRTTYPLQRCGNFRFCTYDIDAIGLNYKDQQGNG